MNSLRFSFDDGSKEDVRLSNLLTKYGIRATFYIPSDWEFVNTLNKRESLTLTELKEIAEHHDIGSHTITHPLLTRIPIEDAEIEIAESKQQLEYILGDKITKFCPPRGYTNPELNKIILKHYKEIRLTKGEGLVHIHPNSGVNNHKHWLDCIDEKTVELWGHSHELTEHNLWGEFEEFLKGRYENTHR